MKKSRNNGPGPATYANIPIKLYKEGTNNPKATFGKTGRHFSFKKGISLSLIVSCCHK